MKNEGKPQPKKGEIIPQSTEIAKVGPQVTSKDIDSYGKFRDIENKALKLQRLLKTWTAQQEAERKLRKTYATWLLVALSAQVVLINLAFFLLGLKVLNVEVWVANTFIIAVFTELASMTWFVVKYLFPKDSQGLLNLIEKL